MTAATPPMMRGRGGPRPILPVEEPYRINQRIRTPEIRVIIEEDDEEKNLGVMPTFEAIKMAQERDLDLVEIAPMAQPPVCKIMDYGRFKYLMERKQREAHRAGKAGRAASEMKDVQLSPRIDDHDMEFKIDRAHRFLQEGHPVRMVVRFLGRDMRHPEVGKQALDTALEHLGKLIPIQVDASPRMEGRQMVALVRLAKGVKATKAAAGPSADGAARDGADADGVATPAPADDVAVPIAAAGGAATEAASDVASDVATEAKQAPPAAASTTSATTATPAEPAGAPVLSAAS